MKINNTITGHLTLSKEQRHFKNMLFGYPRISGYWNFENRECDISELKHAMGVLSHGEQIMVRFFAGIWFGENCLSFDLIDAAKTLDASDMELIQSWISSPVFP